MELFKAETHIDLMGKRRLMAGLLADAMKAAINQTLSRTIMTGVTTLLVVVAWYFFGGQVVHGFSLALIVGILSSMYVASPLALWPGVTRANLAPVKRPDGKTDDCP